MALAGLAAARPTESYANYDEYNTELGTDYILSQAYDPSNDFYRYYYSDYSFQQSMEDPYTGQVYSCREAPLKCYDLARVPKKLSNPTKTTSSIFVGVPATSTSTTTFQWKSPKKPSILIEWVSLKGRPLILIIFFVIFLIFIIYLRTMKAQKPQSWLLGSPESL